MDEQQIVANGVRTSYFDVGSGPIVLLLHGSGPGVNAWANWRTVIPRLSQTCRVVAPDLLGFGNTHAGRGVTFGVESWLAHLRAFVLELGIRRCSIIGNSFGGALALHYTARHRSDVDRLVLMGSVGVRFPLTDGLDAVWGYEPSREQMREMLTIFAFDSSIITDGLVENRYLASSQPETTRAYQAMFPAPRQRWIDHLALPDELLAEIDCDTLLIHGADDQVIPCATSEQLAARLAHARLEIFDQCGHWVQIEKSDQFLTLVEDFLRGQVTTSSP